MNKLGAPATGHPERNSPMENQIRTDFDKSQTSPIAAAHLGAAVVALRRRATCQLSPARSRRLLALADGIETLLPAVERLETACEVPL